MGDTSQVIIDSLAPRIANVMLGDTSVAGTFMPTLWSIHDESYGKTHGLQIKYENISIYIKIAPYLLLAYDRWQTPHAPARNVVDVEIAIMRAIKRKIIDVGLTPHFCEMFAVAVRRDIASHISDMSRCTNSIITASIARTGPDVYLCNLYDMLRGGWIEDRFAIIAMEHCGTNMDAYVRERVSLSREVRESMLHGWIFQIYFSLLCARRVWKQFRHGDLFAKNIMIAPVPMFAQYVMTETAANDENDRRYLQYVVDDTTYNVPLPHDGTIPKIIDFGRGAIPEERIVNPIIMPQGNTWIADHVAFMSSMAAITHITPDTPAIDMILKLYPVPVQYPSRFASQIIESGVVDPEHAFATGVFATFARDVARDKVIKQYRAPLSKHLSK